MSKSEFVDKVAAESGLSKKDAGAAVDAVLRAIEGELKSGGEVTFTGFGKFHVAGPGSLSVMTSSDHFGDRLAAAVARRETQIVLGLDPDPAKLWPGHESVLD